MNAADLMTSARLQRVYRALRDGREHSTRELIWLHRMTQGCRAFDARVGAG